MGIVGIDVSSARITANNRQIVDEDSATLNLPGLQETQVLIPANHSTICKFDSINDPTCKLVLDTIAAEVERALNLARERPKDGLGYTLSDEDYRCLRDLRTTDPCLDKKRIEETKGGLLEGAYRWVLEADEFQQWCNDEQSRLLWIKGDPGKGKTMLLCGILNELSPSTKLMDPGASTLLSYFFCQAADLRISNASAVLRGLIYMLVEQQPTLISYVRTKYDLAGKQLFDDVNAWAALTEIFTRMLEDPKLSSRYLIIDALDECTTDLNLLLSLIQTLTARSSAKWIVTSRNWPSIEKWLNQATQKVRLCLELNEKSVSAAVRAYVELKVDQLAERNSYDRDTKDIVRSYLSSTAEGTFLWVALVCQELAEVSGWKIRKRLMTYPPGLDALYRRMLDQICSSEDAGLYTRILAVVSTSYRPLTLDELVSFIDLPDGVLPRQYQILAEIIGHCGSLLALREHTVFFVHQSAKDFLLNDGSREIFPSGITEVHRLIFLRSLDIMSRTLRRNIYDLDTPGFPIERVKQPPSDPLAVVRYSCIYWTGHLHESSNILRCGEQPEDGGLVDTFLRQNYLYWLEALSLLRRHITWDQLYDNK